MPKLLVLLGLTLISTSAWAERAIPPLMGPVMDEASFFSDGARSALIQEFKSYLPSLQFQVWTVPSLDGESIEALAIRAVDQWKLGQKGQDNGILLLLSRAEHAVRIEVGRGLEGEITDLYSKRVIDRVLKPPFQRGDFYRGTVETGRVLFQKVGGDPSKLTALPKQRATSVSTWLVLGVFALILLSHVFSLVSRVAGGSTVTGSRRRSGWGSNGGWGGGWSGGGGGFGGGGNGGGWSGGGGGFSGGGSSGQW